MKRIILLYLAILFIFGCKTKDNSKEENIVVIEKPKVLLNAYSLEGLQWNKAFDMYNGYDLLDSITIDNNNNIICFGTFSKDPDSPFYNQVFANRLDSKGIELKLWDTIVDHNSIESSNSIKIITKSDEVYIGGSIREKSKFQSFIQEIDNKTTFIQEKMNKMVEKYNFAPKDMEISGQNLIVAGSSYYSNDKSSKSRWILWSVNPHSDSILNDWYKILPGNAKSGSPRAVTVDPAGNIYVCGYGTELVVNWKQDKVHETANKHDWWIKKFDKDGNEDLTNWNKTIDFKGYEDKPNDIAIDSQGNVYVAGYGTGKLKDQEIMDPNYDDSNIQTAFWWIKKYTPDGEEFSNWDKKFSSERLSQDRIKAIAIDNEDNLYAVGNIKSCGCGGGENIWIKKFSPDGVEDTENWNVIIDGNGWDDYPTDIVIDNSGDIYVGAVGDSLVSEDSSYDWWILKFDKNGNLL